MKVVTAAEMRAMDARAIEDYKIPGIVLMENAGAGVARQTDACLGGVDGKGCCIFAGKGNNGGDGFVAARHLYNRGARVKIFIVGAGKEEITGDAKTNLTITEEMGIEIICMQSERDWDKAEVALKFCDCLIDALLGTGFYGELKPEFVRAIQLINHSHKSVISIDIPSGVEADTGQVRTIAVRAVHTVTLGLYKPGLLLYPGAEYAGSVSVADIGMPLELLTDSSIKQNILSSRYIRDLLPRRPGNAHKGIAGRVLVIAGSRGMTGAAALTSLAALRTGAGLVTLGISECLHDIMEVKLTEVMTKPLPGHSDGYLDGSSVDMVMELAARTNVLAIGPGLGIQASTAEAAREIIRQAEAPLVIDADALNALAGCTDILMQSQALAVLTPHPGEMARLTGLTNAQVNSDRIQVARQAAAEWGCILVLKGAPTVVAFPDGEIFINTTGNSGMATGGTGDILTGVIASLIAQGLSSHDAAVAGVYLHGYAGDLAAGSGKTGLIASDLLGALPAAILQV